MRTFARHAIQTHFVRPGESYIDLINTYVKPLYQPGDILSSSEKVIALCQNRVVTEAECRLGQAPQPVRPPDLRRAGNGTAR